MRSTKKFVIELGLEICQIVSFCSSWEAKDIVSDYVNLAFKKFALEGLLDMVSWTHQEAVMESYILSKYQTLQ